jgi:hypothetical protein
MRYCYFNAISVDTFSTEFLDSRDGRTVTDGVTETLLHG